MATKKVLKDLTIFVKIFLVVATIGVVFNVSLFAIFMPIIEKKFLESEQRTPQSAVESVISIVQYYHDLYKKGELTEDEAKKKALDGVRTARYKGEEYFWINDLAPKMIMHPLKPELNGTDLGENKDPKGKRIFVEFARIAKEKGGGFAELERMEIGHSKPVPKISYVKYFEPWGWVIGSGIYLDKVAKEMRFLIYLCGGFSAAVGLFAICFCWIIASRIRNNLNEVNRALGLVAEGDLTTQARVDSGDETGKLAGKLVEMVDSLRDICNGIISGSQTMTRSTVTLRQGGQANYQSITEISDVISTLATAVEELSVTSGEIARSCSDVLRSAESADRTAREGSTIARNTAARIKGAVDHVAASADMIKQLGGSAEKIGNIVDTIEDIADQTNLLALNAAIEAARAGEQGRGFAVVADEVRALAERTTRATKEIASMIREIQAQTGLAVTKVNGAVTEVNGGAEDSRLSSQKLDEIVSEIDNVARQVSQIATATEEQTQVTLNSAEQIGQAAQSLEKVKTETQSVSRSSDELALVAQQLMEKVGKFRM